MVNDYNLPTILSVIAIIVALCLPLFGAISATVTTIIAIGGALAVIGGVMGSPVVMGIPALGIIAASVADEIMHPPDIRVRVVHHHPYSY